MKPSLLALVCQVLSMKIINLIFLYQPTLKVEVPCESIMYINPNQLATSRPLHVLIHLASIVQMNSNLAQSGCTVACEMIFAPWPVNLVWIFFKKTCKHSNLGFHLWSIYIYIYLPKSLLASCKERGGVMAHYILTTKYHAFEQT